MQTNFIRLLSYRACTRETIKFIFLLQAACALVGPLSLEQFFPLRRAWVYDMRLDADPQISSHKNQDPTVVLTYQERSYHQKAFMSLPAMLQQLHNDQEETDRSIQTEDMTLNKKDLNQRPDSSTSPILEVTDNDVLCGRGGLANKHPGNHLFRRVVNANKDLYQSCQKKSHKYFFAISIIDAVEFQGGRFLRRDDKLGKWVTISRKDKMYKTSQALREQDATSSERKSSEAVARLVVEKQLKQRAQKEHISSGAKSRKETAGHSVPTVSNQQSSEGIDQRNGRHQHRRAPTHDGYADSLDFLDYLVNTNISNTADGGDPYDGELDEIAMKVDLSLDSSSCSKDSSSSGESALSIRRPTPISEQMTSLDNFLLSTDFLESCERVDPPLDTRNPK